MKKLAILVLAFGCGGADASVLEPEAPEERSAALPIAVPEPACALEAPEVVESVEAPPAVVSAPEPACLKVWPDLDLELIEVLNESIKRYRERFGLCVEIAYDGIPISIQLEVTYKGNPADALAHYDRRCSGYECSSGHGVWIKMALILFHEKRYALQNAMDHELAHILSGWGVPANMPMHIEEPGHLMNPGCVDHVCPPWTTEDATMICSGVPCGFISL